MSVRSTIPLHRMPRIFAVLLVTVLLLHGAAASAGGNFNLNTDLMRSRLEHQYYRGLAVILGLAEEKSNAITDKWKEDAAAYGIVLAFLRNNPKAMALFKAEVKAGKSPKEALRKAVTEAGDGTPFAKFAITANKYVGPEVQEIYTNLKAAAARAKGRLEALTAVAEKAKDIEDKAEFVQLLRDYGLSGSGIDSLEALEKRLGNIRKVLESPIGTYWGMYETIYKGVEGKEPGGRVLAMFTLFDETAGNLPILGEFVHLYMETAKKMLEATLRLKNKIAQWDMGCVGAGTHGVTIAQNAPGVAFKYPGTACPETGIKNLYVDFEDPDLLYFWTGKKWVKAPDGHGGTEAIKRIMAMLKGVANVRPGTKADVPAAFAFYGVPGGFREAESAALTLYYDIGHRWRRLKDVLAGFDIPKARVIDILETRSGVGAGFDAYLEKHFSLRKNEMLFVYRYVLSALGSGEEISRHREILASLQAFHPKVIVGRLDLPDGLDLAGVTPAFNFSEGEGVLVEDKRISLAERSFRLVLFGGQGSRLTYDIQLGELRSRPLVVATWRRMLTPQRAIFDAELEVSLTMPARIEFGQKVEMRGQIAGGAEPPYKMTWRVDGKPAGQQDVEGKRFTIPVRFDTAGLHDFEVSVTDGRGYRGGNRVEIPVAFRLTTTTRSSADKGGQLVVIVGVKGGSGAYSIKWASDDGQKYQTESGRNRFFKKFSDPKQRTLKWVDVVVFDHETRIEVPVRIELEPTMPLGLALRMEKTTLEPGEKTYLIANIEGGEPDFTLQLYINGRLRQSQTVRTRRVRVPVAFQEEGTYRIGAKASSERGISPVKSVTITVARPPAETSAFDGTYSGDGNYQVFGYTPLSPNKRSLVREVKDTRLVLTIKGKQVVGIFKGKVETLLYQEVMPFECKANGTINRKGDISLPLVCTDLTAPEYSFRGSINGQVAGNGFRGSWGFELSRGGGKWRVVKQ